MNKLEWHTEKRKLSQLKPALYNPRRMTKSQEQYLRESINKFELCDPIIINTTNTVIGGHQRIKILKERNIDIEVDVRIPNRELSENEEKELNLRLNANLGNWDLNKLIEFDKELLQDIGINIKDINKWFELPESVNIEIKEILKTNIKIGDLYELGNHKLLCGDSTNSDHVNKLMQKERAIICLSDPPYSVNYTTKREKKNQNNILNSFIDPINAEKLLFGFMSIMPTDIIIMTYAAGKIHEYIRVLDKLSFSNRYILIWHKNKMVYTRGIYSYDYDPIFIAKRIKSKSKFINNNPRGSRTTFNIDTNFINAIHPTQKPLKLYELLVEYHSNKNDIIYEPFCGSGTTLLSCELHNRKCRAIELSPLYCQVIIDRWQKLTGGKAVKI